MKKYKLIGPFVQLLSMENLPIKGALKDEQLSIIPNAGILLKNEFIEEIGDYKHLQSIIHEDECDLIKVDEPAVCIPGFIDCHTHIAYGGSRAKDFAMRNSGSSYLEIAKSGGGIWNTVQHTRAMDQQELTKRIIERTETLSQQGITTVEVKSGYGLSLAEELKMLRAIKSAKQEARVDLVATCLAAHTLPRDFEGDKNQYLEWMSDQLFPILKKEQLSNRIDAFIEESAFTSKDIEPYFQKAKDQGFDITVHADQFTTGGSAVAVQFEACSADHLEASTEAEISEIANSDVIAVALPGASIGLGLSFTPARKLLDAGVSLAIATDWNPGSAPMGQLLAQATILATFEKLTNAEVLAAITFRAAAALGLKDRGRLAKGKLADFVVFPTDDYQEITYQQGRLHPIAVWKKGVRINKK